MKRKLLLMSVALMLASVAWAQSKSETITRSLEVKNKNIEFWFCVCNINGSVDVEAYDGNTVEVTLEKRVNGKNQTDVDLGMQELQLKSEQGDDFAKLYVSMPGQRMAEKADPLQCGWDWNGNDNRRDYWYTMDYKIKVPRGISVKLSTVNKGDIFAKGVTGNIYASNVNGDVTLEEIQSDTKANTVNGKVEASYVKMPKEFASFKTVNGDIEIFVPSGGNGVFNFQSQWGEIYSDLEFSEKLAPKVIKTSAGNGMKYKVSNSNSYQYGSSGGASFEFETLNGDVYLRKQK